MAIPLWPAPLDDALRARYEALQAVTWARLVAAARLTPAERERAEAAIARMNEAVSDLFTSLVEPALRAGEPMADEARHRYLEAWSAAGERAGAEVAAIRGDLPAAIEEAKFVPQMLLEIENVQRNLTFYETFQRGTAEDRRAAAALKRRGP
jgi:hypothetical protein